MSLSLTLPRPAAAPRRRAGLLPAAVCAVLLAAVPLPRPVGAAGPTGGPAAATRTGRDAGGWDGEAAARFWTPGRMAAAVGLPAAARTRRPAHRFGAFFSGLPSVGTLFETGRGLRAHSCTASVVHSAHGDIILTAAHCVGGTHRAFVPLYSSARTRQPYGIWAVGAVFRSPRWRTTGAGTDLDAAFLRVRPDARGRTLEQLTGGNRLTRVSGYRHQVTVIGYPDAGRHNPADRAIRCTGTTGRLAGRRQMRFSCEGYYGGTSGSPWLVRLDTRSRTGQVIGAIGGFNNGGPAGPDNQRVSYSPLYGDEVFRLFRTAART